MFTILEPPMITPTSRRASSSNSRRLWLPRNIWRLSRMIVRHEDGVCQPGGQVVFLADNWPMIRISIPFFARSVSNRTIAGRLSSNRKRELVLRPFNESCQLRPSIQWADKKVARLRNIWLPLGIRKEPNRFVDSDDSW